MPPVKARAPIVEARPMEQVSLEHAPPAPAPAPTQEPTESTPKRRRKKTPQA